jgi:hypothetical protein
MGGDFRDNIEHEFSRNVARFEHEMERIKLGIRDTSSLDLLDKENEISELKRQISLMETQVVESRYEAEMLRGELELVLADRERLREAYENDRHDHDREIRRLANVIEERRDKETKTKLEDKYRRALVYIDALQSKLSTSSSPIKTTSIKRHPFR